MSEACETCSSCGAAGIILVIVLIIALIICVLCCNTGFCDWAEEWLNYWIDKLPRPKDED